MQTIGVYTFCNTGSVLVHEVNDDQVLASVNGVNPEYCNIVEIDDRLGFCLGDWFIPFDEVMRVY